MLSKTSVKSCKQAIKVTTVGCNSTYFDELFINLKSIKTYKALLLLSCFD